MSYKIRKFIFDRIRFLFVNDLDSNEELSCSYCCKPVLKRAFYCSSKCEKALDEAMKAQDKEYEAHVKNASMYTGCCKPDSVVNVEPLTLSSPSVGSNPFLDALEERRFNDFIAKTFGFKE